MERNDVATRQRVSTPCQKVVAVHDTLTHSHNISLLGILGIVLDENTDIQDENGIDLLSSRKPLRRFCYCTVNDNEQKKNPTQLQQPKIT